MTAADSAIPVLILPGEAAQRLGVTAKTLTRWAVAGFIPVVVLPTGQRRYRLSDVQAILDQGSKGIA